MAHSPTTFDSAIHQTLTLPNVPTKRLLLVFLDGPAAADTVHTD